MKIENVRLVYFSPTGTTRKICEAVADGLQLQKRDIHDLTFPEDCTTVCLDDSLAVIGIPVYAGRVPEDALARLEGFTAKGIPTVLIALYGNREFEDALVELRDVVTEKGFKVVAAGAFIGEHSYSTAETPVAAGRPDADDLALARAFGEKIAAKLGSGELSTPEMEGDVPYRERVQFGGVAPETDAEACVLCGKCATACPVRVIEVGETVETDAQNCIMCASCIRVCGFNARIFTHPVIQERRTLLMKNCSERKEAKTFL